MNCWRGIRSCCLSLVSATVLLTAPAECRADAKAPAQMSPGSLELVVGRDWLSSRSADSQRPAASYVGVSGLIALAPSIALGVELSSSVNPFGCDSDVLATNTS